jgi:hypothetical protein
MSPQKFDDQPLGVSDIPEGHLGSLTWEEAHLLFRQRYSAAGEPLDKVQAWLDDHQVYPKREVPAYRVMQLDWFQMISLMAEAGHWREEANPPGAEGEFET